MTTLEITVTNKNGGPPLLQQEFEITEALAQEFITKMEALVTGLPSVHGKTTKTMRQDGAAVFEITLNKQLPPPIVSQPTFEELFRPTGR